MVGGQAGEAVRLGSAPQALPACTTCVLPIVAPCQALPQPRCPAHIAPSLPGGAKGQQLKPSRLAVSPSMEHMDVMSGGSMSAKTSRNVSEVELAAAAAAGEAAPLLGQPDPARRPLPR